MASSIKELMHGLANALSDYTEFALPFRAVPVYLSLVDRSTIKSQVVYVSPAARTTQKLTRGSIARRPIIRVTFAAPIKNTEDSRIDTYLQVTEEIEAWISDPENAGPYGEYKFSGFSPQADQSQWFDPEEMIEESLFVSDTFGVYARKN